MTLTTIWYLHLGVAVGPEVSSGRRVIVGHYRQTHFQGRRLQIRGVFAEGKRFLLIIHSVTVTLTQY